jgi:hypothetical protein
MSAVIDQKMQEHLRQCQLFFKTLDTRLDYVMTEIQTLQSIIHTHRNKRSRSQDTTNVSHSLLTSPTCNLTTRVGQDQEQDQDLNNNVVGEDDNNECETESATKRSRLTQRALDPERSVANDASRLSRTAAETQQQTPTSITITNRLSPFVHLIRKCQSLHVNTVWRELFVDNTLSFTCPSHVSASVATLNPSVCKTLKCRLEDVVNRHLHYHYEQHFREERENPFFVKWTPANMFVLRYNHKTSWNHWHYDIDRK